MKNFLFGTIIATTLMLSNNTFATPKQIPDSFLGCWTYNTPDRPIILQIAKKAFYLTGIDVFVTYKVTSLTTTDKSFTANVIEERGDGVEIYERAKSKETIKLVDKNTILFNQDKFKRSKCDF